MRKNLILHRAQLDPLNDLNFEQKGKIFDAIIQYQFEGKEPDLSDVLQMAFRFIKNQLDIDNQKYEDICKRNRNNGIKGGRPQKQKKPSGISGNPKNPDEPKKPDNDNDNDNDNDLLFDRFWDLYDKKTGKAKSQKLWANLSKTEKETILNHIPLYKSATPEKQFRKNPETYLKNRAWEDEIIKPTNGTNGINKVFEKRIVTHDYKPGY